MNLPEFFGIDIGYTSIKLAQAVALGDGHFRLTSIGQTDIDKPVALLKDEAEKKAFAEKLKTLKDSLGIKVNKAVVALPEAAIFSKIISVPDLPEDQLERIIYFEARNHLPVPVEDVNLDYIPIARKTVENNKILQILLIAAPKSLINGYLELLALDNIEVLALETESIATGRAMTLAGDIPQGALVVDFASQGMAVSVIKGKEVIFSQSIGTGSDALTQAIAKDYNLDLRQAEQYKITYGLLEGQLEGRIAKSILPVMQIITNELNKIVNFIKVNLPDYAPAEVYLVGEGAQLPGLITFLNLNLGMPVKLADPIALLETSEQAKAQLPNVASVAFTVAVGLALKVG
jgi:type IV pilus assembly protein PilM